MLEGWNGRLEGCEIGRLDWRGGEFEGWKVGRLERKVGRSEGCSGRLELLKLFVVAVGCAGVSAAEIHL